MSAPDSRLRVVATLRADFYDRPLAVQGFGPLVNDATVTIAAMTPAELEAAIVEPAERVGRHVERALVAELVGAVADEPAALPGPPVHALRAGRARGRGPHAGGLPRAGSASTAPSPAGPRRCTGPSTNAERDAVRRLFEHLVVIDADDEPTRRRAARGELSDAAADGSVDAAVDRWASARLLSLDRHPQSRVPTVEVAHEALLREWPRLRRWIDEDRDTLMVLGHLREAAASWVELDRDPGALYRGAQLQVAIEVAEARSGATPAQSNASSSTPAARNGTAKQAAETQRVARQARANRRLRAQLVVIGVALVVALVGGFVAVDQRSEAEQERREATARSLAAASSANLVDDPERSILLGPRRGRRRTREHGGEVLPEAIEALHEAVARSRLVLSVPDVGGPVDWSPDGRTFVTTGPEGSGTVDIRDARTGASVLSFRATSSTSTTWPSAPTARCSPRPATTGPSASGIPPPARSGPRSSSPPGARCGARRSAPMGAGWRPRGRRTRPCGCSTCRASREVWVARLTAHGTEFSPDGERLAIVQTDLPDDRFPVGPPDRGPLPSSRAGGGGRRDR